MLMRPFSILVVLSLASTLWAQETPVSDGLVVWLRADSGIRKQGQRVVGWEDQSPAQNHAAQPNPAQGPTLSEDALRGHPAVHFDGSDQFLVIPSGRKLRLFNDVTTFFVARFDDFQTYRTVWSQARGNIPAPNDWYTLPVTGFPNLLRGDGSAFQSVTGQSPFSAGNFGIGGWRAQDQDIQLLFGGKSVGKGTIATEKIAEAGGGLFVGKRMDGAVQMKGDVAEILIYNRALSVDEQTQVIHYLSGKYPETSPTAVAQGASTLSQGVPANASVPDPRVVDPPGIRWVTVVPESGQVPQGAVMGGQVGGNPLYIARIPHMGFSVGVYDPVGKKAYYPYDRQSHLATVVEIQVLVAEDSQRLGWTSTLSGATLPSNALMASYDDKYFEYIARVKRGEDLIVGKFLLPYGMFISEGGKEVPLGNALNGKIEILVYNPPLPANLTKSSIPVPGHPFDTGSEDRFGPNEWANQYGVSPKIVPVVNKDGTITVAWQDRDYSRGKDSKNWPDVHVSDLSTEGKLLKDVHVPLEMENFGGFTKDADGQLYVFAYQNNAEGVYKPNMRLIKYSGNGERLASFDADPQFFNAMNPLQASTARLAAANGVVAVHFGKLRYKDAKGVNHQNSSFLLIGTDSMAMISDKTYEWTASHSFDQRLIWDGKNFVYTDLGDDFDRGVLINKNGKGHVLFTYKLNLAGSNNNTFSELGGLVTTGNGYLVSGVSEGDLGNIQLPVEKGLMGKSRNAFVLLVDPDFEKLPDRIVNGKSERYLVNDDVVISQGVASEVVLFGTGSEAKSQQNVGVIWLTNYSDVEKENASRPKLAKIGDDRYVALWERWTRNTYLSTYYCVVNGRGQVVKAVTDLGPFPLPRGDDVVGGNGTVSWISGENFDEKLDVYTLKP